MRFVAFSINGTDGLAIENDAGLQGLKAGEAGYPGSLDDLVRAGDDAFAKAAAVLGTAPAIDPASISYMPPFRRSAKIYCIGLNYHDHRNETGNAATQMEYPMIFARFASNLIGHDAPIIVPHVSERLDYEAELVVVIGKPGRYIAKADALDHVAGYSVFNDGTIRDYQRKTPQWTIGKNFDDTGSIGPAFVTADAVPAGGKGLKIESRLNGETMQSANTDDLIFDVATLIALISESATLEPGDLIVTGTPGGVGAARIPPVFMKAGDVCEIEVEGIGLLRNPIAAEKAG